MVSAVLRALCPSPGWAFAAGEKSVLVHNCNVRDVFDEVDIPGLDPDDVIAVASGRGVTFAALATALRKYANGDRLNGDELEALYDATVGTPNANPFGESFENLVERGFEWDPVNRNWSKPGNFPPLLVSAARNTIARLIPDQKTPIDVDDLPNDFDGSSNAIGNAGEDATERLARAADGDFLGSEVDLSVTIDTPDGPLTVDIRADHVTVTPDGQIQILGVESHWKYRQQSCAKRFHRRANARL